MTTTATMPSNQPTPTTGEPKRHPNQVQMSGTLTRDPELRYTPGGSPVASFSMAHNNRYQDKDQNEREDTCFVDVTVFGELGETLTQMLSKGSFVHVTGPLKQDRWETEGQKRSKHKILGFQIAAYNKEQRAWEELN